MKDFDHEAKEMYAKLGFESPDHINKTIERVESAISIEISNRGGLTQSEFIEIFKQFVEEEPTARVVCYMASLPFFIDGIGDAMEAIK